MFKTGDKVRCIDAGGTNDNLKQGVTYTVLRAENSSNTDPRISLVETGTQFDWRQYRFELITETPTPQVTKVCNCDIWKGCTCGAIVPYVLKME